MTNAITLINALAQCPDWCSGVDCVRSDSEDIFYRHHLGLPDVGSIQVWICQNIENGDLHDKTIYVDRVADPMLESNAFTPGQAQAVSVGLAMVCQWLESALGEFPSVKLS